MFEISGELQPNEVKTIILLLQTNRVGHMGEAEGAIFSERINVFNVRQNMVLKYVSVSFD